MENKVPRAQVSASELPVGPPIPENIEFVATGKLKPNLRNARTHSKKQINQMRKAFRRLGSPIQF
ncbi:hypothetical protein WG622_10155 [Cognatishimia sp. D5M38]|uniref:Uncharacterized protein n=1 Tax=Cognatishimia coralii TaxID=3083254 RepID=A0ABU8QGR8_9RHOB